MKQRHVCRVMLMMMVFAVASPLAMAAEHGGEGAHPEPSIWAGDVGNVIWTLTIFLLVVFVLGKFAWNPLLGALQKREDFIRESIEAARRERQEAQELLAKYTEQINKAREEATAICDEARRDAEVVRKRIEGEARGEADTMIKRAKREIEIAHQDAVRDIYNQVAELSSRIAGRILSREVSPEDHRRLIASSLEEIRQKGETASN